MYNFKIKTIFQFNQDYNRNRNMLYFTLYQKLLILKSTILRRISLKFYPFIKETFMNRYSQIDCYNCFRLSDLASYTALLQRKMCSKAISVSTCSIL